MKCLFGEKSLESKIIDDKLNQICIKLEYFEKMLFNFLRLLIFLLFY